MKWRTVAGVLLSIGVFIGAGVLVGRHPGGVGALSTAEWADVLAGVTAPLAFIWLVIGYFQQGEELRQSTKALHLQQEELHRQVQETAALVQQSTLQAQASANMVSLQREELERLRTADAGRARAADHRISTEAYYARRTIQSWLTDPTRPLSHPGQDEARFVADISRHFPSVEQRFWRMTAEAPGASSAEIASVVQDALILFSQATARIFSEMQRAEKLGERDDWVFHEALQDLTSCAQALTRAIEPGLRDK